jgi:hypothetical protein
VRHFLDLCEESDNFEMDPLLFLAIGKSARKEESPTLLMFNGDSHLIFKAV